MVFIRITDDEARSAAGNIRNEENPETVVTNPYSKKMNVMDIDGDGDDDAHDGEDPEHGILDARRSDL